MWVGGVRVVITNDEKDKILMVRQHHEDRDIWMVPGGGIEEGENSIEAAVREAKEETGLDIEIVGVAWHIEEVSPERGQRFVNYMLGEVIGGELGLGRDPEFDDAHQVLREVRLTFHRVIPGFMIQGGCPKGNGTGGPGYCIKGEFTSNGVKNDLKHTTGVLSMARAMMPDSAGSQFFIMVADAPHLDGQYASFGKITEGMEIAQDIVNVKRDRMDCPLEPVKIKTIVVE